MVLGFQGLRLGIGLGVTEHLPGACGGHDARKGRTHRLRASGVSRFEQSVTRDLPPRRATPN